MKSEWIAGLNLFVANSRPVYSRSEAPSTELERGVIAHQTHLLCSERKHCYNVSDNFMGQSQATHESTKKT
jgi:hypothetical protein